MSYQKDKLAKILNGAICELGEDELRRRINKYLPTSPEESHPDYRGEVTHKALKNGSETAIESLTALFNKCWKSGSIPKKWRTAKTILIPKHGKPPSIENLRPISLSSCVGKSMKHVLMNHWQRYLEEEDLFPESMLGFRGKL
ncbi:uncharacterized protein LOC144159996 [Haemaphysalis longicornis]